MEIFTIGHSRHTWELFLSLLKEHEIALVVDVRSNPISRFAPFANIRVLPDKLQSEGIKHLFMGDALGGKPNDPQFYDDQGKPDYANMGSQNAFREGIIQLIAAAEGRKTVLMCAEEDPRKCHRRLLLEPALKNHGVMLHHIRKDGSLQTSDELTSVEPHQDRRQARLPLG